MASFPFYSPVVREALVDIISTQQVSLSSKTNDDDESSFNLHTTNNSNNAEDNNLRAGGTAAIRGKWSGGYASSSSDDEAADKEDDDASNTSESDDYDSSTSISACSTSLGGVVGENQESRDSNNIAHEKQRTIAAVETATNTKKQQSKKNKKYKNKSKDMVSKMGKAPSVLLPYYDNSSDTNIKKKEIGRSDNRVLEVSNVILPFNYINDNPSCHISSMAKKLLSAWEELNNKIHPPTIIVVLLQSGRFASAVFTLQQSATNNGISKKKKNNNITMQMVEHKTSTRYTVRKGQGGAQSSHDQGKHKAKSIGAQLRREGEKQLRSDVHETWVKWNQLGYIDKALWVYVSCPKNMKRDYLHINDGSSGLLNKNDARWRNVPLDVGRPTLEATSAVLDCVLNCHVRDMTEKEIADLAAGDDNDDEKENATKNDDEKKTETLSEQSKPEEKEVAPPPPFTPVHEAVFNGDLSRLLELLAELNESEQQQVDETDNIDQSVKTPFNYDVDTCGGPDYQTALHIAASSTCSNATSLINALLIQGHANPCVIDARGRPPYFLANSDKHRETFRLARGTLGEDYCSWDDGAKVGPALSEDDVQLKKAKALEKKRRQRARQKEKKAMEKAEAEAVATKERAELEKKKQEEDAKRIRDGLKPKPKAQNACDFCHKIVKGKRRSQMFQRLEYAYCSTDCVKKHQRELMAAAAVARFSNN